ncbi:gem-associated protein 8-like [Phymastichus coffea]|uniref:gem-associated protein 8-like n=1 Tax=Phymastichus coffea TaxID=108790 RepID=UPI00273AA2DA|nr:gem-associated protein 8-like [Phymastichus coffea]XP_058796978.1 gem-associated protein 8-like [Phymastichus coffea]XP_058796979.1 gem-associated protein 8-like [Phymastichus coffea]XP_058796980.1 gem-associated protein 8-like [Phymastichus coffea]
MEFVEFKREKKRRRRRHNFAKKHRDQIKNKVKSFKRKKSAIEINSSKFIMKKKNAIAMEANSFWKNYEAAHEWQKRHNLTWWKTQCFALEHENHLLKETITKLINNQESQKNISNKHAHNSQNYCQNMNINLADNKDKKNADDTFEFQLNEDVMNFLAQSVRHKIELKTKKNTVALSQDKDSFVRKTGSNAVFMIHRNNEDMKFLYGQATSRILAMETALQTTIEKHIDISKPRYWPNIPLKL